MMKKDFNETQGTLVADLNKSKGWNSSKTSTLTKLAMMTAISIILLSILRIPIFPAAPWLEYDMADVPILFATFLLGPIAGLKVLAVVCLLQVVLFAGNGVVGFLMHFIATGVFILVAYFISRKLKGIGGMIVALALGAVAMAMVMIPLNLIFTVHVMGTPQHIVEASIWPIIVPFNLIKAGLNATLFFIVFNIFNRLKNKEI